MRVDRASQNVYVNETGEGKVLPAGRSKGKLADFLERKGLGAIRGGYRGFATIRTAPRKFLAKIMMFWGMDKRVYEGISRCPSNRASNRQGITSRLKRSVWVCIGAV